MQKKATTPDKILRWLGLACLLALTLPGHAGPLASVVPDEIKGTIKVKAEDIFELAEAKPELVIIDARLAGDRAEGYIEGSISLPNLETTCERLAEVVPQQSTPTLFYCNGIHCGRSVKAIDIAQSCGYTMIYWFRGGFEEWQAKGYPYLKK